MKKIIYILAFVQFGCKVPQKTEEPTSNLFHVEKDTIFRHDTLYDLQGGEAFYEYNRIDTFYIEVEKECPKAKRVKIKNSNNVDNSIHLKNCFNEVNDLKKSNQVYKSQVDSLVMAANKGNGSETNNGIKPKQLILPSIIFMFVFLIIGRLSKLVLGKKLPI